MVSIVGVFVLATFYALHFAAAVVLPMALSLLFSFLLAPAVRRAEGVGLPRFVTASVLVSLVVGAVAAGSYSLSGAAAEWLRVAPTSINEVRERFEGLNTPLADVREAAQAVEEAVEGISGDANSGAEVVAISSDGWLDPVIGRVPYLVGGFAVAMLLTIFLLTWADELTSGFAALRRGFGVRRRTLVTIHQVQRDVATYLVTVATINAALGVVVWLALRSVGMPNAPLWGTLAGVANFAPYIGPAFTAGALLFAGANAFESWQAAVLPGLIFCAITALEGQLITPAILGHRLSVPPPLVFIAVFLFGWLWGVVGALIAVPILIVMKRLWLRADTRRRRATARPFRRRQSNVIALSD
jgi:predicted PurR-regulated permease PerM